MMRPTAIVNRLLESDEDVEADLARLLTGFKPDALKRRDSKYAKSYLEFNGKLGYGNGITPAVYIYRIISPRSKTHGVTGFAAPLISTCERWVEQGMARKGPAKNGAAGRLTKKPGIGYYPA